MDISLVLALPLDSHVLALHSTRVSKIHHLILPLDLRFPLVWTSVDWDTKTSAGYFLWYFDVNILLCAAFLAAIPSSAQPLLLGYSHIRQQFVVPLKVFAIVIQ